MLSISCHIYYKVMLLFLSLLSIVTHQTNMIYKIHEISCVLLFLYRTPNLLVHSPVDSEYLLFFCFLRELLSCCWAVNSLLPLKCKTFPFCWQLQDWYGPSSCRGNTALGSLLFSLHVIYGHFLSWNELWHEKWANMQKNITVREQRHVEGNGVWVAVTLFTFSLPVCPVMLFVDECLVGWNPVM